MLLLTSLLSRYPKSGWNSLFQYQIASNFLQIAPSQTALHFLTPTTLGEIWSFVLLILQTMPARCISLPFEELLWWDLYHYLDINLLTDGSIPTVFLTGNSLSLPEETICGLTGTLLMPNYTDQSQTWISFLNLFYMLLTVAWRPCTSLLFLILTFAVSILQILFCQYSSFCPQWHSLQSMTLRSLLTLWTTVNWEPYIALVLTYLPTWMLWPCWSIWVSWVIESLPTIKWNARSHIMCIVSAF